MDTYYKIAGLIIRIIGNSEIIKELSLYNKYKVNQQSEDYTVNLKVVDLLPNFGNEITYQDKQNIIYDNGKYRYINSYCVVKTITSNYFDIYLRNNYMLSDRDLFNAIGFDTILARDHKFILHASVISYKKQAILFSAPSGTGKSTQANLWKKYIDGVEIINGDRAVIGEEDNLLKVYSTPFCGTSNISINSCLNLGAIIILRQGKINKVTKLSAKESYKHLYSQINWVGWNADIQMNILNVLEKVIKEVNIYYFECLPNRDAVETLKDVILKEGLQIE